MIAKTSLTVTFVLSASLLVASPAGASASVPRGAASVGALVDELYAALTHPRGGEPDWVRVGALFHPFARVFTSTERNTPAASLDFEGYRAFYREWFKAGSPGFVERELRRQVVTYDNFAHVWSTYENLYAPTDPRPFARGVNSFQLVRENGRWFLLSGTWQNETPGQPLP